LLAADVRATPLVELVSPGGDTSIEVVSGETFALQLRITAGPEGISSYGFSVEFDGEGLDAFDVVSATENLPAGFDDNLTPGGPEGINESSPGSSGYVLTCEAFALGPGVSSDTFVACEIAFQASGVLGSFAFDAGLFHALVDGVFDNEGNDVSADATFVGATVTVVPEVGTGALVAFGLAGVAMQRRRSARARRRCADLRNPS
jgi:hypothetical protein